MPAMHQSDDRSLAARTRAWALAMTRIPSVTGTRDEADFPAHLREIVTAAPGLAGPHVSCWTIAVTGDPLGRECLALLVRGRGGRTVVLSGHFDTVGTEDYGELRGLAIEPELLQDALLSRLRRTAASPAEARALADLESGQFLPGRGLLDMKAGLAAGLALAEQFAGQDSRQGNLLVLAVPDEEANSAGARQAAVSLPQLAAEHGLDLVAAINLDSMADDGDGRAGRIVALGTVGKLLLTAFVAGQATHACYPFAGISAAALAGALAAEMEWSPEIADGSRGVAGVPPALLSLKDSKGHYDVTTPAMAFASWNALSYGRSPEAVLQSFEAVCERACAGLMAKLAERARSGAADFQVGAVRVLRAGDLRRIAYERSADLPAQVARQARELSASGQSIVEQCRRITEVLWAGSGLAGPAVVIGFGSMPYLPVSLGPGEAARRLDAAVSSAIGEVAARHGTSIGTISHFAGISDVSFLGEADLSQVPVIAANTPAWGTAFPWPEHHAVAGLPTINAGPWGRDYHTPLERLHVGYGFEVLPELVGGIVERMLVP